ncbi:hypothetical protein K933_13137, partial [Candidatus Halobonum tyrrellensis G22]
MSDAVKVQWKVPAETWDRFREFVQDEYGRIDRCLGREVEFAMREYADADGGQRVEDLVDRLVQAAGRTPGEAYEEVTGSDSEETVRPNVRVNEGVVEQFRITADKRDQERYYGGALTRALRVRMEGGRYGRLERKLDRVVDDAESILSQIGDSGSEDDGLSDEEE